jgi:hypothetical protein
VLTRVLPCAQQYAGLLLTLGWALEGLPEELAAQLRGDAERALRGGAPPPDADATAREVHTPPQPARSSASSSAASSSAAWAPPVVAPGALDLADVASRFEAALAAPAPRGASASPADAATAAQVATLMGGATRGVLAMHAADPKAAAAMRFVLQFGADTLARRGDAPGAALLARLEALLAGAPYDAAADVALGEPPLRECYAAARRRAAMRGWRLRGAPAEDAAEDAVADASGESDAGADAPAVSSGVDARVDPDAALKDAFAYALLVYWSRLRA